MTDVDRLSQARALFAVGLETADESDMLTAIRIFAEVDPDPDDPVARLAVLMEVIVMATAVHDILGLPSDWGEMADQLEATLAAAAVGPAERADVVANLGLLRHLQFTVDHSQSTLESALAALRTAADDDGHPQTVADRLSMVARAELSWHEAGFGSSMLAEAELRLRRAIQLAPDSPSFRRVFSLISLGRVLCARADVEGLDALRVEAASCFSDAAALRPVSPQTLDATLLWGMTRCELGQWAGALLAFELAAEHTTTLFGHLDVLVTRLAWLERWGRWGGVAAVAAVRAGSPQQAVELLERTRGLVFGTYGRFGALGLGAIVAAAEDAPAVYLVCSEFGGAAVFVHHGAAAAIELPALTIDDQPTGLRARLTEYLDAYDAARMTLTASAIDLWANVLGDLAEWAGGAVLREVVAALGDEPRVHLIPVGQLAFVPWHATSWTDPEATSGRRFAIDRIDIAYAPSLASLAAIQPGAARGKTFAVCDPRPVAQQPLPAATVEVAGMEAALGIAERLDGEACTRDAVIAGIRKADVVHLACHAMAEPWEPGDSHLVLSGNERLTVADLVGEHLQADLIVLSACETNAGGRILADEGLSLAHALLEASVGATVGSAWLAPDAATAAIMTKFYDLWASDDVRVSEALRQAQRWFRDTGASDIAAYVAGRVPSVDAQEFSLGLDFPGLEHSHPLFWAAFTYSGR